VLGIDGTPSFQREGRPGTVTQQTLQIQAIVCFDAYAGIKREASSVLPGTHGLHVFALEQSAPGERSLAGGGKRAEKILCLLVAKCNKVVYSVFMRRLVGVAEEGE